MQIPIGMIGLQNHWMTRSKKDTKVPLKCHKSGLYDLYAIFQAFWSPVIALRLYLRWLGWTWFVHKSFRLVFRLVLRIGLTYSIKNIWMKRKICFTFMSTTLQFMEPFVSFVWKPFIVIAWKRATSTFFEMAPLVFHWWKKVILVWNDMRMSKWWQLSFQVINFKKSYRGWDLYCTSLLFSI